MNPGNNCTSRDRILKVTGYPVYTTRLNSITSILQRRMRGEIVFFALLALSQAADKVGVAIFCTFINYFQVYVLRRNARN